VIEMPIIRQAGALVEDARTREPRDYMPRLVAWARDAPEQVAELCALLARIASDPTAVSPDSMLEHLDAIGADLTEPTREAHRLYWHYQQRDQTHNVPPWIGTGERIYQRNKARRSRSRARRAAMKEVA
jgi:hypothetical protein